MDVKSADIVCTGGCPDDNGRYDMHNMSVNATILPFNDHSKKNMIMINCPYNIRKSFEQ